MIPTYIKVLGLIIAMGGMGTLCLIAGSFLFAPVRR